MKKKITKYLPDILAVLLLSFCSFIFVSQLFLQSQMFGIQDAGQGDITHQNYPFLDFYAKELKDGSLPLWTNLISTGYPLLAEGEVGTFYIPNLILYSFLETYLAFNLSYLLVFVLASNGLYFYCRHLGLTRIPSVFGGIIFGFNFFLIGHSTTINIVESISLIPWVLLISDKFFKNPTRLLFLLVVFILSQQLLTGFMQITVYLYGTIFLLLTLRYFNQKNFWPKILLLLIAVGFSVGLSAIQLIPTFELYQNSTRLGVTSVGFNYPFKLDDLLSFIYPYFWGDPSQATFFKDSQSGLFWENNLYSGILPFIFLLIGLFLFKKRKELRPFIILFVLSLLFSLNWLFFLNFLPPFSLFREPQRALSLTLFCVSVISAFSLDYLLKTAWIHKHFRNYSVQFFGITIVCLSFLNIYLLGHGYYGGVSRSEWLKVPETVSFLQSSGITGRVFSVGSFEDWNYIYNNVSHGWRGNNGGKLVANRAILHPDANMVYNIPSFYSYTAYRLQNANLINSVVFNKSKLTGTDFLIATGSAKLLGMENVQYLISSQEIKSENPRDLDLIWKKENSQTTTTYSIYKNNQFIDKIHPVKEVLGKNSVNQIVQSFLNPEFNPRDTALVLGFFPSNKLSNEVSISEFYENSQNLSFKTKANEQSFIVIAMSNYPGWHSTIDNQESSLILTNINSYGLYIPKGEHQIRLFYKPFSFTLGLIISIGTILFGILIALHPVFKKTLGKIFNSKLFQS